MDALEIKLSYSVAHILAMMQRRHPAYRHVIPEGPAWYTWQGMMTATVQVTEAGVICLN